MTADASLGLTESEAARRRAAGDGNDVQPRAGRSYARIVWQTAFAPVNFVLFGVSALLVLLGLPLDAGVTTIPVLLNVLVSAGLEVSAKWRLDRLRILSTPKVTVTRDGHERTIDLRELVRGDVVVLQRGDQVVLDGEIVEGELEVDESLLTGESEAVIRRRGDQLLSGSACVSGRATMQVIHVGLDSYASRLTAQAQSLREERTPLQRDVDRSIVITAVVVTLVSVVAAIAYADATTTRTEVVQAAAVLVALVPQGLAIMVTVTYAAGALRISRAGALVQRINAVESMSRVDTLILDKTGTITSPRFELRELLPLEVDEPTARRLLQAVAPAMGKGDRIGAAIARSSLAPESSAPAPADVIPFSSARRWSGVALASGESVVLGAPNALVEPSRAPTVSATAERWADDGLRVLMLARARTTTLRDGSGQPRLPQQMSPVALLAFAEEVRPDANATLRSLEAAGVDLKVASGDDPRTVGAIARRAGLAGAAHPIAAAELDSLGDEEFAARLQRAAVIGRVEPSMKAKIIRALRARGRYVAMIGDGVNDILAIRAAQLGVAMESGSSASRAVADLVLLGDRFAVLPQAVAEGRRIVDGMLRTTCLLLSRTLYMLLLVVAAALLGLDFPFTPRNNSLLALVTVGLPCLVLVLWARPVASPRSVIRTALRFVVPAGVAVAAVSLPVYAHYLSSTGSVDVARSALTTITVYCGIGLIPFLAPPTRRLAGPSDIDRAGDWRPTMLAAAMIVLYGAIAALPTARWFFDLESLPLADVIALALLAFTWSAALYVLRGLGLVERLTRLRAG